MQLISWWNPSLKITLKAQVVLKEEWSLVKGSCACKWEGKGFRQSGLKREVVFGLVKRFNCMKTGRGKFQTKQS